MQSKLATWSAADSERKFDRMLRVIAERSWLQEAARITLSSRGARTPGVDGVDKKAMEESLAEELACIRIELLAGTFQPQPAKRVYIRKTNGKQRPLGIPTLRDRIVQRAMLMVMEPIWESDFHRVSYGFRPQRSVHLAIRTVKLQLQDGAAEPVNDFETLTFAIYCTRSPVVGLGGLIQTASGSGLGSGHPRTKRSGCAAHAVSKMRRRCSIIACARPW